MIFNKSEAATYCRVSIETLDRYKDTGRLGYTKIGKRIVFRQIELDQFLESLTIPAKEPLSFREQQIAANGARQHLREVAPWGGRSE
jgi:excisionase family DNA binding protein